MKPFAGPVVADLGEARNSQRPEALEKPWPFVSWPDLWASAKSGPDWLIEPILARGRGHALYAPAKAGKSLLALWLATRVIAEGTAVVYLDFENSEADLADRLADMGHGPTSDLRMLHYSLLPWLPPLDTAAGGRALLELADLAAAQHDPATELAVVIDTMGRAVDGEENSADTFRAFYTHTGAELKRRRLTWVRLDHSGKDRSKGQRGSSAKADDVDLVWRLGPTDHGVTLHREASRVGWAPESVAASWRTGPRAPDGLRCCQERRRQSLRRHLNVDPSRSCPGPGGDARPWAGPLLSASARRSRPPASVSITTTSSS